MKTLFILRHAKAERGAPAGDHARMLTARGVRNATAMGAYIGTLIGTPDAIITSDAMRARQTAELVAHALEYVAPLIVEPRIYEADLATLLALVRGISDAADHALLVGHNPWFEELAEALTATQEEGVRLPTAGLAIVEFDINQWDAARNGTGHLRAVVTPRTIE